MSAAELSYLVLRPARSAETDGWWAAARRSADVPAAVTALMRGRTRVELSADEADATLLWAAGIDGWADADPKPLLVYGGAY
jgi:hypothetical protein